MLAVAIFVPVVGVLVLWSNLAGAGATTPTPTPTPPVAAATPRAHQPTVYQNAWIHIGGVTTSADCPNPAAAGREWRLVEIGVSLPFAQSEKPVDLARWLLVKGYGDDDGIAPSPGLPTITGACPAGLPSILRPVRDPTDLSAPPVLSQSGTLAFEVPVGARYPYLRYQATAGPNGAVWLDLNKP